MKKIISLLICIMAFAGGLTLVQAKEKTDVNEAIEVLNTFDIVRKKNDEDAYSKEISRADFAIYAGNIVNINEYEINQKRYYTDVPMDHWALNSINNLTEMGILTINENASFRPSDSITRIEALKVLLELMGYGEIAENEGGYPQGYIQVASRLDLLNGEDVNQKITVEQAVCLIYDAVKINVCRKTSYSDGYFKQEVDEDETLLSLYKKVYYVEAQVTDTYIGSMTGGSKTLKNQIKLDGEPYDIFRYNPVEIMGREVRAFYEKDSDTDVNDIILLYTIDDKDKIVEFDMEDFISYEEENVNYYKDEQKKSKLKIAKGATVIKNGDIVKENISAAFSGSKGDITCIDTDKNGEYDLIFINVYENLFVGYIDTENLLVYDVYRTEKNLDLSESKKEVDIFNTDGSYTDMSAISLNDVLTVYKSDGYVRVYITRKTTEGQVYAYDNDEKIINIGDEHDKFDYELDADLLSDYDKNIQVGSKGIFYVDRFGHIAYFELTKMGDMEFGFIEKCMEDEDGDSPIRLKIFNEAGEHKVYDVTAKVTIDGTLCKEEKIIKAALNNAGEKIEGQLIRFVTDSEGKIRKIDTAYSGASEEGNKLIKTQDLQNLHYFYPTRKFGNYILMGSDTLIFGVPSDKNLASSDEEDFRILRNDYFNSGAYYDVESYKIDNDSGYETVIITKGGFIESTPKTSFMVSKIENVLDEDGEICERISGCSSGVMYTYYASSGSSFIEDGVKSGDIIRLTIDSDGKAKMHTMIYSYEKGKAPEWAPRYDSSYYYREFNLLYGQMLSLKDNVIKISYTDEKKVDDLQAASGIGYVVIYDPEARGEKVRVGSINELKCADTSGGKGDWVFVQLLTSEMKGIFCYKD